MTGGWSFPPKMVVDGMPLNFQTMKLLTTEPDARVKRRILRLKIFLFLGLAYYLGISIPSFILIDATAAGVQALIGIFTFALGLASLLMRRSNLLYAYSLWVAAMTAITTFSCIAFIYEYISMQFGEDDEVFEFDGVPLDGGIVLFAFSILVCVIVHGIFCMRDSFLLAKHLGKVKNHPKNGQTNHGLNVNGGDEV